MKKSFLSLVFAVVASLGATKSQAVTITLTDLGGIAPGSAVGGGNLPDLFRAAADVWETAFTTAHALEVRFQWGALGSAIGSHSLTAQGGVPSRETIATITIDGDGTTPWFLDLTPLDASEFGTLTTASADLGGGVMNTGRRYDGGYTGPLVGGVTTPFDGFSTVIHEIGHALGLSSANTQYQGESWPDNDIDVIGPRPFAGAVIPTNNSGPVPPGSSNAHIGVALPLALMRGSSAVAGTRRIPSEADVVANAEIQDFAIGSLDPYAAVPEPTTAILAMGGLLLLARRRR